VRIAIVGAGISGLTCAHLAHRDHHVTVFEAEDRPGGHAHTIDVQTPQGVRPVDTGFIVFNDRNYPGFRRLLSDLGVPSQPSTMSFSVSDGHGFEYNGASPNGLFANRRHLISPAFHGMIADLVRFNRDLRALPRSDADPTLGEWLGERGYGEAFVERLIMPQVAAVWSADPSARWSFPARFLAEFFDNHGMLGFRDRPRWRTVRGGSRRYVEAVTARWRPQLRLSSSVEEIRRGADGVDVRVRGRDGERFDAVVLATHADQALAMLADPTDRERELLGALPYQRNEAVLHTDPTLLPRRRRAWASWNYHLRPQADGPPTVTYHLNRLQSLDAGVELCVTLNRSAEIDPDRIIRRLDYAHPVFTRAGIAAQRRHAEISGRNRTHFCGAYWAWGFHEDGVQSAVRVARELGIRCAGWGAGWGTA
jgi:predicted NAD/FAD-binding protein